MTNSRINPASMGGEPGAYSNGILCKAPQATLYLAGQIGIDAKGVASTDFEAQTRQTWSNIEAILGEAGYTEAEIADMVAAGAALPVSEGRYSFANRPCTPRALSPSWSSASSVQALSVP